MFTSRHFKGYSLLCSTPGGIVLFCALQSFNDIELQPASCLCGNIDRYMQSQPMHEIHQGIQTELIDLVLLDTYFAHTLTNRFHRFPICRIQAMLDTVRLVACFPFNKSREFSERFQ